MNPLKSLWHRLMGTVEELAAEHTAIVFHWPGANGVGQLVDKTFVLSGVLTGSALHTALDALIEEHAPATDGSEEVITEITIFWHRSDGSWDMEEVLSHYYA